MRQELVDAAVANGGKASPIGHPVKPGQVRIVLTLEERQLVALKRLQVAAWERVGYAGDMISYADILLGLVPQEKPNK